MKGVRQTDVHTCRDLHRQAGVQLESHTGRMSYRQSYSQAGSTRVRQVNIQATHNAPYKQASRQSNSRYAITAACMYVCRYMENRHAYIHACRQTSRQAVTQTCRQTYIYTGRKTDIHAGSYTTVSIYEYDYS